MLQTNRSADWLKSVSPARCVRAACVWSAISRLCSMHHVCSGHRPLPVTSSPAYPRSIRPPGAPSISLWYRWYFSGRKDLFENRQNCDISRAPYVSYFQSVNRIVVWQFLEPASHFAYCNFCCYCYYYIKIVQTVQNTNTLKLEKNPVKTPLWHIQIHYKIAHVTVQKADW